MQPTKFKRNTTVSEFILCNADAAIHLFMTNKFYEKLERKLQTEINAENTARCV